jgi:hypothetical protein
VEQVGSSKERHKIAENCGNIEKLGKIEIRISRIFPHLYVA